MKYFFQIVLTLDLEVYNCQFIVSLCFEAVDRNTS